MSQSDTSDTTIDIKDSGNESKSKPIQNAQVNIVHIKPLSSETSVIEIPGQVPTNGTEGVKPILYSSSSAVVHIFEGANNSSSGDGLDPVEDNLKEDGDSTKKDDLLCDGKLKTKPVSLVCEPDIVCCKESDDDGQQKLTVKNIQKLTTSKLGVGKSSKTGKRKKDEQRVLKKEKMTGVSPPKVAKKKPKSVRDLEKTLNCLLSDSEQVKDEKAYAFAQAYFIKVTETLLGKDDATYSKFMKTMNNFGVTIFEATELFRRVTEIFEHYPELGEEFLAFLLPEQAMECGKFMEYIILTKMRSFCRKLEVYYSKQPSHLHKIYSSLAALASNNEATMDDLRNTILPLLKNNSLLVNMFLELMPTEAPHASTLTDYECMDFKRVNLQNPSSEDWFETIEVPAPVEDNMYGGDDCICSCHLPSEDSKRQTKHCVSCGTKFVHGRVYIRSGGMLHPAKITFNEMRSKVIDRLSIKNVKPRQKIGKNQTLGTSSKRTSAKSESPSTSPPKTAAKAPSSKSSKKGSKGKAMMNHQKKVARALGSKGSHKRKAGKDQNMPKPPRKRLKTSSLENDPCDQLGESGPSSCKKSLSRVRKAFNAKSSKIDLDFKDDVDPLMDVNDTGLQSSEILLSVTCSEASALGGNVSKEETPGKESPENIPRSSEDSCDKGGSAGCKSEKISEEDLDKTSSNSDSYKKSLVSSHVVKKETKTENNIKDPKGSKASGDKEGEIQYLSRIVNDSSDEDDQNNGLDCEDYSDGCFECPETVYTSDDSPERSSKSVQKCRRESISCSETEDNVFEKIETTDDNITSEDERNILDEEDSRSDSSIESNNKESSQMDVDDFTDDSDSCPSSPTSEIDVDSESDPVGDKSEFISLEDRGCSWTRDEDKIILRTFQAVNGSDQVFQKICEQLPSRSAEEVKLRFQALMSFLQKITGDPVLHN